MQQMAEMYKSGILANLDILYKLANIHCKMMGQKAVMSKSGIMANLDILAL